MSRADQSLRRAQPEDVLAEVRERHRRAQRRRRADDEADLRLDVEPDRGAEDGGRVGGRLALARRADDVGPGDHDRAGAAVVTDGQMLPVGRQRRRCVRPEDLAHVGGVVLGGVEVDVVRDLEGQVQGHLGEVVQQGADGLAVGGHRQPRGERAPDVGPGAAARGEQRVERGPGEQRDVGGAERGGRGTGVQDVTAEPDPDPAPVVRRRRPGRTRRREGCADRRGRPRAGRRDRPRDDRWSRLGGGRWSHRRPGRAGSARTCVPASLSIGVCHTLRGRAPVAAVSKGCAMSEWACCGGSFARPITAARTA